MRPSHSAEPAPLKSETARVNELLSARPPHPALPSLLAPAWDLVHAGGRRVSAIPGVLGWEGSPRVGPITPLPSKGRHAAAAAAPVAHPGLQSLPSGSSA